MKKKELKQKVESVRSISNTLSGTAKEFADAVVAAFDEAASDDENHEITDLKNKIEEVAARFAKQDEEVANAIAKAKQDIARQVSNSAAPKDKLTKEVAKEVANAIANCKNREEVRNSVGAILKRNDISGLSYGVIIDYSLNLKIDNDELMYDALHKTRFTKFLYAEVDRTVAAQVAKQWDKASNQDKAIQQLEAENRTISTKYVYKRQRFAFEDLDDIREDGQLQEFLAEISAELRKSVKNAIVSAILVGDNVNSGSEVINTYETIGTKVASDSFTTVLTSTDQVVTDFLSGLGVTSTQSSLLACARLTASRIWNPVNKKVVIVMHKDTLTAMAGYVVAAGGDVSFRSKEEIAAQIGVDEIYTTDAMPTTGTANAPIFIALIPDGYWVKEKNVLDVAYPTYEQNANNLQYEIKGGGKIHDLLSTAVFKSGSGE